MSASETVAMINSDEDEERFFDARSRTPSVDLDELALNPSSESTAPLTPEERNLLVERVLALIDFYFGDANFSKDQFLRKHASSDPSGEGWIPVQLVGSFKKMKLLTTDPTVILEAMKRSSVVILNETEDKLRRKETMENFIEDILARTIHFSVPHGTSEHFIRELCSPYGEIARVRMIDPAKEKVPADIMQHCVDEYGHLRFRQLPGMVSAFVQYGSIKQAGVASRGLNAKKDWRFGSQVELIYQKPKAPGSTPSHSREGTPSSTPSGSALRSRSNSFNIHAPPFIPADMSGGRPRSSSFHMRHPTGSPPGLEYTPEPHGDRYSPGPRRKFFSPNSSGNSASLRSALSQVESPETWRPRDSPSLRHQPIVRNPVGPNGTKGFGRPGACPW